MIFGLFRRIRRFLSGNLEARNFPRFGKHRGVYDSAVWLVRFYYIANIFFVYNQLDGIRNLGLSRADLDPVWPMIWLDWTGLKLGSLLILHLSVLSGFLGIVAWHMRSVRILIVLSQLMVAGLYNSFGAVNHGLHEWFWIAFCFVFLPSGKLSETSDTRTHRFTFLAVFSMAQGLILLFYSLSGFYKVRLALLALLNGQTGGFAPEAMALTLANRMLQTNTNPVWGPLIVENYTIGWPLYLFLYYIEFVSIMVFLRPDLHRIWGICLIAFHFGTFLFMEITFAAHVLINGMLFVCSPFAPSGMSWRRMLRQLPIIGLAFRPFLKRDSHAPAKSYPKQANAQT